MIRRLPVLWRAAATAALLCFAGASAGQERPQVDVELVLAVDISYSMDYDELALQREGYIAAITSEQFLDAMRRGPLGKIALTYVEWAGAGEQQVVVPWLVVDGPASASLFAQKLKEAPIRRAYRTSISEALKFSEKLFGAEYKGIRRVIDVSGDGTNNQGDLIEPTRDDVVRKGITINGLPIMLKTPLTSMIDLPELDVYYEDCVIGGPGAFLVPVRERHQFADAIRNKLILEVAGILPGPRIAPEANVIPAVSPPRVSCTIGEQMWQRRWGGEGLR
ncbi:MAG: DUF1194 domain-containing protein [Bradyrhizobiaceae bacterium]|nr:DUF1194 domain-containing protein [Bradyrhizobiaceae bacterium]